MQIIQPDQKYHLPEVNQDFLIQELTPLAENIVFGSALALKFEAAFLTLLIGKSVFILGSYGLHTDSVQTEQLPTWFMPHQAQLLTDPRQLSEMAIAINQASVCNALGISVVMPQGVVGALWFINALHPLETIAPQQNQLLEVYAHQIVLILKKQLESLEMQQPHKIARERDFAFSVVNSIPSSVAVLDKQNQIIFVNSMLTQQFGYTLVDFQTHKSLFNIPEADHQIVIKSFAERTKGKASSYRCRMFRKDNTIALIEVNALPMIDQLGKIIGSVATIRDITEELDLEEATLEVRKAINKKYQATLVETKISLESEKSFAFEIMETLQDGFALLDNNGKFEYVNSAFAALSGTAGSPFIGHDAMQFAHPDDVVMVRQKLEQLKPKQIETFQHRIVRRDGQMLHLSVHASLRLNSKGVAIGVLISARDITEKLESQAKVAKLEQQIENTQEKLVHGEGFSGRLEKLGGTVGLLQMVAASPVNGAISLEDAKLYLLNGRVVAVEHQLLEGQVAVENLVQRQHGHFQFIPNQRPEKTMFNLDPVKLTLEYLTKQDEQMAFVSLQANQQHVVTVPDSLTAKAFIGGVGGIAHFQVTEEENKVVLVGRGIKVVVLQASQEDFLGLE